MLLKHPAPRMHAKDTGVVRHGGSRPSGEISHIPRGISRDPIVLVVERDGLLRWALYETLTDAGFRVLAAPTSVSAETWLRQIDQDVALALVDEEAWPLTPAVRAVLQTRWPSLPIVVMLHGEHSALEAHGCDLDATDVLIKPFDLPEDLVTLVERLTGFPHTRAETRMSPAV
jgi:DNA-binding response OmpR family regulator